MQVELETLCDLVLEFDVGLEDVVGRPGLGESEAVLGIGVLALEVTGDGAVLVVPVALDEEGDV